MKAFLLAGLFLATNVAYARPPANIDPDSPEARWYSGAMNPACQICCSIADGRVVRVQPDPQSPEGWDVWFNDKWTPIPAGVRAIRCKLTPLEGYKPAGDYPPEPAGRAVIWEYPAGIIRCWVPPDAGG